MRCIRTVGRILTDAGLQVSHVALGEAIVTTEISLTQNEKIRAALVQEGFELLDDKNSRLVERIKNLIIAEIHYDEGKKNESSNFSDFLSRQTNHEYSFLSKLFSSVAGMTIEKYIISQKIERVKEWLIYDELSLQEIAYRFSYSSSQYLSNQFKQVTGMSPTTFK
ncbi:MAG: helix-turn-helix transcriptional regulator, partial [Bacteroidota bacterium]|nr:helix-turn-helix transcriptional regulator [Bacteroidota bacterium]